MPVRISATALMPEMPTSPIHSAASMSYSLFLRKSTCRALAELISKMVFLTVPFFFISATFCSIAFSFSSSAR